MELKWKNDETVMLDGFVRVRIKFPINKKNLLVKEKWWRGLNTGYI